MTSKILLIVLSLLFLLVAIPRLSFPDLDHGDEWADADILIAANNFAKFGFIKTRFLPFFEAEIDAPKGAYLHYPPLGTIINGLLRIVSGRDSIHLLRSFALFFSLLNLLFWYLFVKKFSGSTIFAFLCGVFYLFNPFFIYGVDSLGQISYADFFRSLILFVFIVLIDSPTRKKPLILLVLWSLFFIESLISYEYILYLSAFFVLFKIIFKVKNDSLSWKYILILCSAPVFGFLLHVYQNIWYLGSFSLVWEDLRSIAAQRIGASKDSAYPLTIPSWWQHVLSRNLSLVLIFNYFLVFLGVFALYLFYQRLSARYKQEMNPSIRLLILAAICGISWYIAFPSHSLAHAYVSFLARHLVPMAALSFAVFFSTLFYFINERVRFKFIARIICLLLLFSVLFNGIARSDLALIPRNIKRAKDFIIFRDALLKIRQTSKEKDQVAINLYRRPFVSYYTGRNAVAVFKKADLEEKKDLPRYFILMPYNDQRTVELAQYIKEHYELMFECKSPRFPSGFWELKQD